MHDYSNGYRFYTRAAAQLAAGHAYRYGSPIYLSEILALWMRCGLRIIEFKSLYVGRNEGLSKLRAADLVKAAIAVFEISARYHLLGFRRQSGRKEYGSAAAAAAESSSHIRTRSKANDAASQE